MTWLQGAWLVTMALMAMAGLVSGQHWLIEIAVAGALGFAVGLIRKQQEEINN